MAFLIVLLFLATPFIEISLFIEVGSSIGIFPTLALTVMTSVLGLIIVREQGISNLQNMQNSLAREEIPIVELVHAIFLAMAGILLVLPGFFTDTLGILFLIPPVRTGMGIFLLSKLRRNMTSSQPGRQSGPTIVEGDYWEENPEDNDQNNHPRLPPGDKPGDR